MSKKMKRVALDSSFYGSFEHQRIFQDYHEIKKETEMAKSKLEAMNQRKLTLLAEVRFLRQRHKQLLEIKAENPPQGRKEFHRPILQTRHKRSTMENMCSKKIMEEQKKSPILDTNVKEMSFMSKKYALKTKELNVNFKGKNNGNEPFLGSKSSSFDLKGRERNFGAKEDTFKHPSEVLHWNKKESFLMVKETDSQKKNLVFDLNQMERSYAVREEVVQNRAPVIDLNLNLGEEDDLPENQEALRYEEPKNSCSSGSEEQLNDFKVSICRNAEDAPNCSGKRKISWQDPLALKV